MDQEKTAREMIHDLYRLRGGCFDVVTANPPYLRDDEVDCMQKIGWPEPEAALRGGAAGTAVVCRLINQSRDRIRTGGYLLLEAAPMQMGVLRQYMSRAGYVDIFVRKDLSGKDRVIGGRVPSQ